MAKRSNTELSREINRDIVLELVRARQPVARVELARESNLQNSTISSIVEQLKAEAWICEGEVLKTARGRRPTQISLNLDVAFLVADVHQGRALLAAVDLNGRIITHAAVTLSSGPQSAVQELGAAMRKLRDSLPGKSFRGAGVTLPGRVDRDAGRLMLAPNLDWLDYPIRDVLERELKLPTAIPVELENDANACMLAELWFGRLEGTQNAVLLAISEGVGASLLADGRLISGLMGLAGEFGHVCFDPTGPRCGCGRRGCWEVFASSTAARRYYTKAAKAEGAKRGRKPDYAMLCRLALSGDHAAASAIGEQATAIGRGLRLVTATLSPETILFTGEITLAWSLVQPILERECRAGLLGAGEPPRLIATGDGEHAHLLGAAAVVLERHPAYYRSRSNQSEPRKVATV